MRVFKVKLGAIGFKTMGTGFICFQEIVKKGVKFHDLGQAVKQDFAKGGSSAIQTIKQKYQGVKQKIRRIKQQGNGNFIQGFKLKLSDYNKAEELGLNPRKRQLIKEEKQQLKQLKDKIKQQGGGNFLRGLAKVLKQLEKDKKVNDQVKSQDQKTTIHQIHKQIPQKYNKKQIKLKSRLFFHLHTVKQEALKIIFQKN